MKKTRNKFISKIILVSLICCVVSLGCDEKCYDQADPLCENYDPCFNEVETSAEFTMAERVGSFSADDDEAHFPTDTVIANTDVRFRANEELDKYYWTIGTDPNIFRKKEFTLSFQITGSIKIRLIGEKKVNPLCFPNDDGIDTVEKILTFIPKEESPIWGKFRGYDEDNPDSLFTYEFSYPYRLTNFPNNCSFDAMAAASGFTCFVVNYNDPGYQLPMCNSPSGNAILDENNRDRVIIDYSVDSDIEGQRINKRFIGKRVQ